MTNLEEYISTGILEEYCLNLLDPEQKQQVEKIAQEYPIVHARISLINAAILKMRTSPDASLPSDIKEKTWDLLQNSHLEKIMDPQRLPLINSYSDINQWRPFVQSQLPKELNDSCYLKILREDEKISQEIVWTKNDRPEEIHDNERESLLILEGICECEVGGKIIQLKAGDYFEMPPNVPHTMRLRTPELLALVQRVKID